MRNDPVLTFGLLTLLAPLCSAQRIVVSPAGNEVQEGNTNNTIPFWADSATYQQIHNQAEMARLNGGAPLVLLGLGFRKDADIPLPTAARSFDVQIVVNSTTVSSQTITTTFATNLGSNATTVLPYTNVSIPALVNVGRPNPQGFNIPFNQPYVYMPTSGNFVWEWRHKNATSNAAMAMDAVTGTDSIMGPNEGKGCTATGRAVPATVGLSGLDMSTGIYRNLMNNGPANAPAAFFFGLTRAPFTLPGLCSRVELAPLIVIPGSTDGFGDFDLTATLPDMRGLPQVELLGQFVFLDQGLPLGLGLSDMSFVANPFPGTYSMARAWAGSGMGNGNENATTGSTDMSYGLVTAFKIP